MVLLYSVCVAAYSRRPVVLWEPPRLLLQGPRAIRAGMRMYDIVYFVLAKAFPHLEQGVGEDLSRETDN